MFYAARMVAGALSLIAVYLVTFALYVVVPGRWVDGYVRDDAGRTLRYHLNGLRVFALVIGGAALLAWRGVIAADWVYLHRVEMLVTAIVVGLVFTAAIVLPAPPTGKALGADLYLGRWKNPQWLGGRV